VGNLSDLRENAGGLQHEESLLLQVTSIQESLRQWVNLQSAFEWQLQQTAKFFERDRRDALAELQARLHLLID
jgi:hypothetical protein